MQHHELGTSKGVVPLSTMGLLPTYNFQDGSFRAAEAISGETMNQQIGAGTATCFSCAVSCKRVVEGQREGLEISKTYGGPEYESIGTLGPLAGVDDIWAIAKSNELCNALGLDTISTGGTNRFLPVAIDPETGGITSIVEKSSGAELLTGGGQARFLCAEPVVDSSAAKAQITLERSDSMAGRLLISGQLADCPYRLRLTLAHESPVLKLDLEIDYGPGAIFGYKAQPGTLLRHVFPFKACSRRWVNLPFGVYETAVENPIALDFLDLDYDGGGVALLNDGVPGLHTPGEDVAVLISDGVPPLRGVHRYRYGIYPHGGDWREARVPWRAWEFQQPLGAKPLEDRRLSLPFSRSYLQMTGNAVLSGLHFHEGKPRARFYDTTGSSSSVAATWHFPWPDPVVTDLNGRHPRPVSLEGRTVRFNLPAWGIVTLSGGIVQQGGPP